MFACLESHTPAVKKRRKRSLPRLSVYVSLSLGALVLTVAALLLLFDNALLNRYGKGEAERAFAKAHPGYVLQIGKLEYAVAANRLIAESVTLSTANATLKIGPLSLTGVRWARLLWGAAAPAEVLAAASLDATNLQVEFPRAHYGIRCGRLRASVPGSELIADAAELQPLAGDEAFFAAHPYRAPRFHVVVPECRVLGLAYGELLEGKSYRATSVQISRPVFDALINRDKPPKPFVKSPLMVNEALAVIRRPLQLESLSITNGHLTYRERLTLGTEPAVLTIGAVSLSAEGIANRGEAAAAIQLRGQGELMNAGTIKLLMSIPIISPVFSLHY